MADLVIFVGLGFIFTKTRVAEKIDPDRLIAALIGAVAIAGLGLSLWFAFVARVRNRHLRERDGTQKSAESMSDMPPALLSTDPASAVYAAWMMGRVLQASIRSLNCGIATRRTSSTRLAKMNSISLRTSREDRADPSGWPWAGSRYRIPARRAASTFSLMPPMGSTSPVSVISPVIATSLRAGSLV